MVANNANASSSPTGDQHDPESLPSPKGRSGDTRATSSAGDLSSPSATQTSNDLEVSPFYNPKRGNGQQRAQHSSRDAPNPLPTQKRSPPETVPRILTELDLKLSITVAGADLDGQIFHPLGTTQHSRRRTQLPTVTLASQIGQGAAWTAFVARLRKPAPIRLVAKVHRPEADQDRERDIRKAILKEWEVVSGRLAHLQGHTIPMHYGLWESQDHTLLTIMQDVGRPILRSDWESPDIRKKVEAAVLSVYEAGVTHDDLHWGHLYIFHDEVKLIDFNMTTLLTRKTASSWLKFGQIALRDLTIVPPWV